MFLEKYWRKKSNKIASDDHDAMAQYGYAQNALFYRAAKSKDKALIAKAAQAVYHWPSFAKLIAWKTKDKHKDKSVISVDKVQLIKEKKKTKKPAKTVSTNTGNASSNTPQKTKAVQGESISDDFQTMEPAVQKLSKSKKSKAKERKLKSNALIAKASKNLDKLLAQKPTKVKKPKIAKKRVEKKPKVQTLKPTAQNWKAWSRAKSKNENLCDFTIWLNQKNQNPSADKRTPISPKKSINKAVLKSKIKKSIKFNSQVISAPLAKLLAKQGHRKEAIKMYQKLSLIFPEKSSFFAAEISTLKKK